MEKLSKIEKPDIDNFNNKLLKKTKNLMAYTNKSNACCFRGLFQEQGGEMKKIIPSAFGNCSFQIIHSI